MMSLFTTMMVFLTAFTSRQIHSLAFIIKQSYPSLPSVKQSYKSCHQRLYRSSIWPSLTFTPVDAQGSMSMSMFISNSKFSIRSMAQMSNDGNVNEERNSVTGIIYQSDSPYIVQLYTKEGCTLCDKVKDVLQSVESSHPHSLEAIDITDPDKSDIYEKYKYDIPVLHINGHYWTKHRLTEKEAKDGLDEIRINMEQNDTNEVIGFTSPKLGEPDAGEMERKQMERLKNNN